MLGQSDRAMQQFRADLDRITELLRRPALSEKELADTRSVARGAAHGRGRPLR